MARQQILKKKGIVLKEISPAMYLVKDISSEEEVTITISGKMKISKLKIGQLIYFQVSPYELTRGRYSYRENQSLRQENLDLGIEID